MEYLLVLLLSFLKASLFGVAVLGFAPPSVFKKTHFTETGYHHGSSSFEQHATANNWIEAILMSQQTSGVSTEKLRAMIERANLRENFVVVITGATGGIGSAICQSVLKMGGLIVAVDLNEQALLELQQQDEDRIRTITADFADLKSVAAAADSILGRVEQIDVLVNNAGIFYDLEDDEVDQAGVSQQGYDMCFQINYLSHFLLTEKLLPKMNSSTGRVVHVSSGLSWGVNGSGLIPDHEDGEGNQYPAASRGSNRLPRHVSMSYGNSKLGQIWHASHLNRLGATTSVCACPSWAATGIAGNEEGREALEKLAFSTLPRDDSEVAGPGVKSILNAMFLPKNELDPDLLTGQKLVGNAKVFDIIFPEAPDQQNPILLSDFFDRLYGRANLIKLISTFLVMPLQRWCHEDLIFQDTSFESGNKQGQIALYDWSKQAVSQWVATPVNVKEKAQRASRGTMQNEDEGDEELLLLV